MKLVLAASGLFVALLGVGIGCGPTEKYCYHEGKTCKEEERLRQNAMNQPDGGDAGEVTGHCFDEKGKEIPCP